jgi:preprotein translocase subunit SecG
MGFIIGVLTFIMVLDCLLLILLILVQLPKKEAGAGLAFGGAASDALFGAGSGTVLTKVTKYAAGTFFVLAIVLAIMQSRHQSRTGTDFQKVLDLPGAAAPGSPSAPATQSPVSRSPVPASTTAGTNPLMSAPIPGVTNTAPAPAASPGTSAPAQPAPQPNAE